MSKNKNAQLEDGEVFEIPVNGGWFEICCDCNLVHFHLLEKKPKGGWKIRAWRDTMATKLTRKRKRGK